ncbi:hypothetical protein [Tsukamurella pseudospumae]|uniref:Uncharacterized protein n=1 Tax=Tsukamurella pseudospumae TaxID=239498 RepID=A0A137YT03_9ACTN|nr:hypothetical protein [Tsukamurella pseudospumae]KXO89017.1 hypothetical protein AXK61_10300 [Tsukamurella pseudospumae]
MLRRPDALDLPLLEQELGRLADVGTQLAAEVIGAGLGLGVEVGVPLTCVSTWSSGTPSWPAMCSAALFGSVFSRFAAQPCAAVQIFRKAGLSRTKSLRAPSRS